MALAVNAKTDLLHPACSPEPELFAIFSSVLLPMHVHGRIKIFVIHGQFINSSDISHR